MNLELKKAIDQISKDKGLDRDMLVDTLEDAVRTSVIRKYGENIDVEVSYNDDTGEIQVHQFKIVVDDVADPDTEIDIEKARELDPSVQLDDEIGFPLKVTDLGRIAAQSAKQVIIQRMRDAEQELIYEEFKDRVGVDKQYAAFGKVTEGMDVVDAIARTPRSMFNDKPTHEQKMKTVTVETFGVEYPEPETC